MAKNIAAIILAAGQSTRMGAQNKLLLPYRHKTMIAQVVESALAAGLSELIVVTGHQADSIKQALQAYPLRYRHNPDFASGLASSLCCGLQAVADNSSLAGALVLLADMPQVSSADIKKLLSAFEQGDSHTITAPYYQGKRGNPVLWGRAYFNKILALNGDSGAKQLLGLYADNIMPVAIAHQGIFNDVDTPEAYAKLLQ